MINQSVIDYLDGVADVSLQSQLDVISSSRLRHPDGHFVYYQIYDDKGQVVAKIENNEYKYIDSIRLKLKTISRITDVKQLPLFKRVKINKRLHIGVVYPLYDSKQQVKAFILGAYAVSDKAIAAVDTKLRRTLTLVILIVLITSGLLYPVIL